MNDTTGQQATGASAGVTGGRTPTGGKGIVRTFLLSPFSGASWLATAAIFVGFGVAIVSVTMLSALFSTGGSLLIWLVGVPIIGLGIEWSRLIARAERWRASIVGERPLLAHPYRTFDLPPRAPWGSWIRGYAETQFLDANRWRDVVYVLVLFPLALLEFAVVSGLWLSALGLVVTPLVLGGLWTAGIDPIPARIPDSAVVAAGVASVLFGLLLVPVAASAARGLMILHRAVIEGLLCVSPTEALREDVERLRGSRSAAVELEASELRRLERDLHDGAQQRLVALAIDLGMAEERIDTDPAAAKVLVVRARDQARQALAELRDLVRGVAPAILVDRGLVAALAAVAGGCPIPTFLDSGVAPNERLPAAVERAAYFVVVEALANAAKHSAATRCDVYLRRSPTHLMVEVRDNGAGGAVLRPGGGLAGLRDRVGTLDGWLGLASPLGGPTVVHVEMPIRPA
jgi:signal transduction histidine kinase